MQIGGRCADRILFLGGVLGWGCADRIYPIRIPFWGVAQTGRGCTDGVPMLLTCFEYT